MTAAPAAPVRIVLPARAEYVAIVRGVLMVVAGRSGLTIDGGDDLALAVDEMCAALLAAGAEGELTVDVEATPETVGVRVASAGEGVWPPHDWDDSAPAMILEALVDEVTFASDDGQLSLSASKAADAAG